MGMFWRRRDQRERQAAVLALAFDQIAFGIQLIAQGATGLDRDQVQEWVRNQPLDERQVRALAPVMAGLRDQHYAKGLCQP